MSILEWLFVAEYIPALDFKNGTSALNSFEISIFYLDCREIWYPNKHGFFNRDFPGKLQVFYTG